MANRCRYGCAVLPPVIGKDIFERVHANRSEAEKRVMNSYYRLDTNAVPEAYCLRRDSPFNYYAEEVAILLNILDSALYEEDLSDDLLIGRSLSEWELKCTFNVEYNKSRLYWFHRTIEAGMNAVPDETRFLEVRGDDRRNDRLSSLISYLNRRFEATTVSHFKPVKIESVLSDEDQDQYRSYLNDFQHDVNELFHKSLSSIVARRTSWSANGNEFGIPGNELTELLLHSSIAFDHCKSFIGREELVASLTEKIVDSGKATISVGKQCQMFNLFLYRSQTTNRHNYGCVRCTNQFTTRERIIGTCW
jgi:hypothetical protein